MFLAKHHPIKPATIAHITLRMLFRLQNVSIVHSIPCDLPTTTTNISMKQKINGLYTINSQL